METTDDQESNFSSSWLFNLHIISLTLPYTSVKIREKNVWVVNPLKRNINFHVQDDTTKGERTTLYVKNYANMRISMKIDLYLFYLNIRYITNKR